jgi:hypothetical protein
MAQSWALDPLVFPFALETGATVGNCIYPGKRLFGKKWAERLARSGNL